MKKQKNSSGVADSINFLLVLFFSIFIASEVVVNTIAQASDDDPNFPLDPTSLIKKEEAIIKNLKVIPINAGINPVYKGYRISGQVMLGANPCSAKGVSLSVEAVTTPAFFNGIHVKAFRITNLREANRFCTMEYRPVFQNFIKEVRGIKVLIDNVEQMGHDVDASMVIID
ncbi:MAG: hypothetical protein HQK51_03470 [Oligoflexia bacterium]|nr:hypothetical protein [Oligoflexia bacterium]